VLDFIDALKPIIGIMLIICRAAPPTPHRAARPLHIRISPLEMGP
jgi:hypothetical protein